jgi:hypothetical protein
MATHLTPHDAQQSLHAHVTAKGDEIRAKYGPAIGWNELLRILEDRQCVRYPCEIVFDQRPLEAGELAYSLAKGARPEDGFTVYVHPLFRAKLERVSWLVLYQLVRVNYGAFASSEDAEVFGAHALGLDKESYYQALCEMADLVEKPVTS